MSIEKLRPSFTFTEDRLRELSAVVPEAFADGKINWDTLREALGETLEDETQEHFGLFWPGKHEARKLAAMPSKGTLIPQPGQGVDEDSTHNLFIEGDNLEVLKLMQKSYAGRVKLIYIDPPYNTGNDFVYPDDYSEPLDAYLKRTGQVDEGGQLLTTNRQASGRFHSNWLNMIFPRLQLARLLLREDGFIFISIDHHEVHNLVALMNEVFGEENFIALVANVNNPKGRSDDKFVATAHEHLLIYRKSEKALLGGWAPEDNVLKRYRKTDKNGLKYREIDLRKTGDADRREDRPNMFYYFLFNEKTNEFYPSREGNTPTGFIQIKPTREDGVDGRWRWEMNTSLEKIEKLIPKFMPVRQTWTVVEMDYLDPNEQIKPTSAWTKKEFNSERGSEQFIDLEFKKEDFPRPKPLGLIRHILELATTPSNGDIILDYFAGSGTTAHGIMELNAIDGGNRKYILVQYPEKTKTTDEAYKSGFSTIAEICKERIRRASHKLTSQPEELFEETALVNSVDYGFVSYELGVSHFSQWKSFTERNISQLELRFQEAEMPLIDGWKPENLLAEILLLQGFPLDSRIRPLPEYKKNDVKEVSSEFCAHRLYICLDTKVQPETVTALHLRPEDILVTLDTALTDEAKIQLSDQCNLKVI